MRNTTAGLPRLLRSMRISVHVLFALLIVVGMSVSTISGSLGWVACVEAAVLSAWYLVGTVRHNRNTDISGALPWVWLLVLLGLWAHLIIQAAEFVWLLFPLVFVIMHVARGWRGALITGFAWLAAVVLPVVSGQWPLAFGSTFGPGVGSAAAVVGFLFYQALRDDAAHQRAVADKLRETQATLAETERRAGRLAEREHLAREIHDTLAQGLSSIVLLTRAADKSLAAEDLAKARNQVAAIADAAGENLAEARRFVAGLTSPALVDSVPDALRALADSHNKRLKALGSSTVVQLYISGEENPAPDSEAAGATLRVVQEATGNALKHANPTQVVISYTLWPDAITVDIVDDGHGFDPQAVVTKQDSGYGLNGLRRRIDELGGTLSIESSPTGTAIAARIPKES
ncbi:sensor histidine kinase [Corynebacterium tapiri]|uniref:Sensor histidine kinase n=1 Tax=Corynebacterium tapiri TaxID=1448266 RepID=A0A5C4U2E7_9CORY|nr:histidine kinase [Corynebacterium tapiri]TNL95356.1 sensor histidine kinase [Corynebacterium tapiri]